MKIQLRSKKLFVLPIAILLFGTSQAQMVGPNAYIQGTGVEMGINGLGGFEGVDQTASPAPVGMHFRSNTNLFGFVANPQNDGWTNYDGDFFTPGSPENGWGFELDTINGGNNCEINVVAPTGIPGAITSWSYTAPEYLLDWEGDYISAGTNLHFKINYNLQETDLFYTTTVSITNNTSDTIPQLYYYRNLDPDNNVVLTSDYTTQNTILSQPYGGGTIASVCGTASTPWNSYFAFVTDANPNWRAGYGGFSNRDASDMWNGTGGGVSNPFVQTVGATHFSDEAIFIAYSIQNLVPSGTETFKFCSVFDPESSDCAIAALGASHAALASVNVNTAPFVLSGGSPAGGTYSGIGVVGGTTFDPSVSGAGDFTLLYSYSDSTGSCSSSTNVTIHVDLAMGIDESALVNTVVYPNPMADEAAISIVNNVKLVNAQLRVFDVLGKEVKTISNISSNTIKIDRAGLSQGMYFYKLYNDNKEISSGKIILK